MYLGIDFGTSYSQVSTMYLNEPLLLLRPGEYGIPSEFYYDYDCDILVGKDAMDAGQGIAAANLVSEVKMKLGQTFTIDGRSFKSQEIVQEIYKNLVATAMQVAGTRSLNTRIQGVVLSVPAEFTMQECDLLRKAAENCLPGQKLPITTIIREPVAAALAYYHQNKSFAGRNILVYDLGGGTCDVALVRPDSSLSEHYDVVGTAMVRRGGRDWDHALAEYIRQIVESKTGIRIKGNPGFEEKLRRTAIDVKHKLSDRYQDRANARIELNGRITTVPITRKIFDEVTIGLLRETMQCLTEVYDRYASTYSISDIICVGGSSNMLQIEEGIRKQFPQCNVSVYQPEYAVVNGATIYAEMLQGKAPQNDGRNTAPITEKTPFSYGVQAYEDYQKNPTYQVVYNMITKGDTLPAEGYKYLSPIRDNQYSVYFAIYESGNDYSPYPATDPDKRYIGDVTLILPPNTPMNTTLTCHIKLNTQGMMEVSASEPTGRHIEATFHLKELSIN